jgi:superfamily II DNA or RNA helicase
LCKRVEQGDYLYDELKQSGESVDNLIGNKQDFDSNCRILVATISKASTGFDWPTANSLIVACDTDAYFIQTLGRVFRSLNTTPIVFDLIDNNPILFRHYKNREEVYKKSGGIIKKFNIDLL